MTRMTQHLLVLALGATHSMNSTGTVSGLRMQPNSNGPNPPANGGINPNFVFNFAAWNGNGNAAADSDGGAAAPQQPQVQQPQNPMFDLGNFDLGQDFGDLDVANLVANDPYANFDSDEIENEINELKTDAEFGKLKKQQGFCPPAN
jgi:hypothetical protein